MARVRDKEQTTAMRKKGFGIGEIAQILGLSKSTVSYWCRDIPFTKKQLQALYKRGERRGTRALREWSEKIRSLRLQETVVLQKEGAELVGKLSRRDRFIAGLALYWSEGYKKGNEELGFTNSDPAMITFFMRWLAETFEVKREDLILRVSINNIHKYRIGDVERYWSKTAKVPLSQFSKTSLITVVNKKQYTNKKEHFGTLRIKVRRGTNIRRKILGAIEQLKKSK